MDALDRIAAAPRAVVRAFVDQRGADPPYQAVWPTTLDVGRRGLQAAVPKAAHAREDAAGAGRAARYMAQEKFNGAWVLWDGAALWTKTGVAIAAPEPFRALLPPGFAVVGELWLGYGHRAAYYAARLACNARPRANAAADADADAAPDHGHRAWQHARIVAFDAPGLGDDVPYRDRYAVLRVAVGAWTQRRLAVVGRSTLFPLQLARQYGADAVPAFFREVVEGGTRWADRRFRSFGIPAGAVDARGAFRLRGRGDEWLDDGARLAFDDAAADDRFPAGEGLMLWDQDGRWTPRGGAGRSSPATLKYKPRLLTAGWVVRAPRHTHHAASAAADAADENDDRGDFCGYRVDLRWWDPFALRWLLLKPVVSPAFDVRRAAALFPPDRRVFFTFVWYDRQPMYMTALGPTLRARDALATQRARTTAAAPDAGGGGAGAAAAVRSLDDLADAARWADGEVRALFPADFAWHPDRFCRSAGAGRWRLLAPNPALSPDARWQPAAGGDALRRQVDAARRERDRETRAALQRVQREADAAVPPWLRVKTRAGPRFLLTACACVAAWGVRQGLRRTEDWWTLHPATRLPGGVVALPRRWGPFAAVPSARSDREWINGIVHVLLAGIAAAWLHVGVQLATDWDPTTVDATAALDALERRFDAFWILELEPRWFDVRDRLYPRWTDYAPWDRRTDASLGPIHAARAVRDALPAAAAWAAVWGVDPPATFPDRIDLDADAAHDVLLAHPRWGAPYRTLVDGIRQRTWRSGWRDVRVRSDTALPEREPLPPEDGAEADPGGGGAAVDDPPDAYQTAVAAMDDRLLNAG